MSSPLLALRNPVVPKAIERRPLDRPHWADVPDVGRGPPKRPTVVHAHEDHLEGAEAERGDPPADRIRIHLAEHLDTLGDARRVDAGPVGAPSVLVEVVAPVHGTEKLPDPLRRRHRPHGPTPPPLTERPSSSRSRYNASPSRSSCLPPCPCLPSGCGPAGPHRTRCPGTAPCSRKGEFLSRSLSRSCPSPRSSDHFAATRGEYQAPRRGSPILTPRSGSRACSSASTTASREDSSGSRPSGRKATRASRTSAAA